MNRFERISGRCVNVDKIRCFWHEGERGGTIVVELDDGSRLREHDGRKIIERCLDGDFRIVQIVPCIKPLYARYTDDGKEVEYPIYYLGVCASGYVRPLDICGADGGGLLMNRIIMLVCIVKLWKKKERRTHERRITRIFSVYGKQAWEHRLWQSDC